MGNWDVLLPRVHGNRRMAIAACQSLPVRRYEPVTCTTQDGMKHTYFEATTLSLDRRSTDAEGEIRNCSMDMRHEPSVRDVVAGRVNISGPDVRAPTRRFLPSMATADWS